MAPGDDREDERPEPRRRVVVRVRPGERWCANCGEVVTAFAAFHAEFTPLFGAPKRRYAVSSTCGACWSSKPTAVTPKTSWKSSLRSSAIVRN